MDWQKLAGGLLDQVTGKKEGEEEPAEENAGGLMGLAGAALSALSGGADKQQLLGQLMSKVGGNNLQDILAQLGLNPDIADNPDAASAEDLEKINAHLNGDESDESVSDDASDETASDNSSSEENESDEDESVAADADDETDSEEAASDFNEDAAATNETASEAEAN